MSKPIRMQSVAPVRWRVLLALIFREMSTRYGRSWGGYLWAIVEPAGGIILLTAAFSLALHKPPLGANFALFYATGVVPFLMYSGISAALAAAVRANKGLLTYPIVNALDTLLARWLLETMSYLMIAVLIFGGVMTFYGLALNVQLETIISALSMTAALGLGIGTFNCVVFGFFPIWQHIWSVLNRPLFIISGVLFTYDSLPRELQGFMWYNPLMHIVGEMRRGFYGTYDGAYVSKLYVYGIGFSLFLIGAYLLRRHQTTLASNS